MLGQLPESLTISGKEYRIRSDYRNALMVFEAFKDPDLDEFCKSIVMTYTVLSDFKNADDVFGAIENGFEMKEAMKKIHWFLCGGNTRKSKELATYDWEQDEQMIFSAVNKVAKVEEVRAVDYMHWWTFLGYFHEIGNGTFSYIVNIRSKLNHGKKLEKEESEFLARNKDLVLLKRKLTKEEQEQEDEYQEMLSDILG